MEDRISEWEPVEVKDWRGTEQDVLVLNYTMSCALSCDFCCYGCNPSRNEKMPLELASRLIREASEIESISSIAFTGGEPMLHLDEICSLSETIHEAGLRFTVATAAHWASSASNAKNVLELLANNGLTRLNISHDPSHAEFVDSQNVLNAAGAADALGIETHVVGTFLDPNGSLETFLPELKATRYVHKHNKYVAKVGMAKKWDISQEKYGLKLGVNDMFCYRRVNHDIVVWHDGTTYPCCSTFNRSTYGLSVGNANDMSLKELWSRVEGSLLFRILKRQGFGKLYALIKTEDLELYRMLPDPERYVGPCSLCNGILGHRGLTEKVLAFVASYEAKKAVEALDLATRLLGAEKAEKILTELA